MCAIIFRRSHDLFGKSIPLWIRCSYSQRLAKNNDSRSPQFQQWPQPFPNEHISTVAFSTIAPHPPIKEFLRTLNYDVTKMTWMQIESKHSGKAFVFHIETSLK